MQLKYSNQLYFPQRDDCKTTKGTEYWKNGSFRNTENLQYKITAHSVLLSLFMETNRKCNNSQAHQHQVAFCLLSEPNIPERPEYEKNINTISMYGEKFYQLHSAQ